MHGFAQIYCTDHIKDNLCIDEIQNNEKNYPIPPICLSFPVLFGIGCVSLFIVKLRRGAVKEPQQKKDLGVLTAWGLKLPANITFSFLEANCGNF